MKYKGYEIIREGIGVTWMCFVHIGNEIHRFDTMKEAFEFIDSLEVER